MSLNRAENAGSTTIPIQQVWLDQALIVPLVSHGTCGKDRPDIREGRKRKNVLSHSLQAQVVHQEEP